MQDRSVVEVMARAGFRAHHLKKGLPASAVGWEATREDWLDSMRAAINETEDAGYAIVPVTPTQAMLKAGLPYQSYAALKAAWRAMVEASR